MDEIRLGAVELKFAGIVWANAPIPSGELVKICKKELDWSKSTTYTVLRRLCERGLLKNENGVVDVLVGEKNTIRKKATRWSIRISAARCPRLSRLLLRENN